MFAALRGQGPRKDASVGSSVPWRHLRGFTYGIAASSETRRHGSIDQVAQRGGETLVLMGSFHCPCGLPASLRKLLGPTVVLSRYLSGQQILPQSGGS